MNYDAWERIDVAVKLKGHEFFTAECLAEDEGFSSAFEYVEHLVRSALLDAQDRDDLAYLPAHAYRAEVERAREKQGQDTDENDHE